MAGGYGARAGAPARNRGAPKQAARFRAFGVRRGYVPSVTVPTATNAWYGRRIVPSSSLISAATRW